MIVNEKKPPRKFSVGKNAEITISDCGTIKLDENEMVTFVTETGNNYDVAAKSWGFYATPSVNGRLKNEGFKTAIVKNPQGRIFVMLVLKDKISEFEVYLNLERAEIIEWLDEK
jgi:hypothetical protein